MWMWVHKAGSPKTCFKWILRLKPWLAFISFICFGIGLYGGLWQAPPDYQQGDAFRIIYIHVPSAIMSMGVYFMMASAASQSRLFFVAKLCPL